MATTNPRINITIEESIAAVLNQLAQHEHKSVSNIAKELILEALERREDIFLTAIASARDISKAKRKKHGDVWK